MSYLEDENKIAFMSCVEIVLMRRGNVDYNLVVSKLYSLYNCDISECIDHPERLRDVLKEVYKESYSSVLNDIEMELERLVDINKFKIEFFKIMKN